MSKHKVPYLAMRNGPNGPRPRWNPGPTLRAQGCKGRDLKDADGHWLSEGAAIDAAKALNVAMFTPPSIAAKKMNTGLARTLGDAADRFEKSSLFTTRKKNTRRSYAYHLTLIRAWAGDVPAANLTRAVMRDFYDALREERGHATANAVMRTLKRLLNYATNDLEWTARNRAAKFEMSEPDGRREIWSPIEIMTFVAAADYLDLGSQGDGAILGCMTGQRQEDIVTLAESAYDGAAIVIRQGKTDTLVRIKATMQLRARIALQRARKERAWPNIVHSRMLVCETTGLPYGEDGTWFRTLFRKVRAFAGGLTDSRGRALDFSVAPSTDNLPFQPLFSILRLRWQDFRDTAVTYLAAAGATVPEIATITGHSLKTVTNILDKHYFVREDALGDAASAKLEIFLTRSGM